MILYGKNEFYNSINNKIYNILVIDNKIKEKKMIKIINLFINNQNKHINEKHYVGIDFEFNKVSKTNREVALMQICLQNDSKDSFIFIIYPPELNNTDILISLLTFKYIIKILHGAESLDIPYIFDQLLISKNNVNLFCNNFYDTKHLCDYFIYKKDDSINHKEIINTGITSSCSIYKLLLSQNIITNDKYDELDKIEDTMGPIYLIQIDIHNLSDSLLKYSLYDVLFLPELIKKILNYGDVYKNIIPQYTNIINKYKRNIELDFYELEKIINSMNIMYFYFQNKKYTLNDIWLIYFNIFINFYDDLLLLFNINYFKKFIKILTKLYIYIAIFKKFKIYKSKNNHFYKFNYQQYIEWIKNYNFIYELFNNYYNDFFYYISNWN